MPKLREMAEMLSGVRELRIWHDQLQYKPADIGGSLEWHQDLPEWPAMQASGTQITAWIALDDVGPHNGCMVMVAGSHRWEVQNQWLEEHVKQEWQLPEHPKSSGRPVRVLCPVHKGHAHFHHSLTWHTSGANPSGMPRRAVAIHMMSSHTLFNAAGNHAIKQHIQNTDGEPIRGENFPLIVPNSH